MKFFISYILTGLIVFQSMFILSQINETIYDVKNDSLISVYQFNDV